MLVTIVERKRNSSEIVGFKMAVSETDAKNGSIGAGYVRLTLSQIFRVLDFKVVIFDNRKEIADITLEGKYTYAIIMTVGHKSDELVLK